MGTFSIPDPVLTYDYIYRQQNANWWRYQAPPGNPLRHRAGACYWNEYLFSLVPRLNPDDADQPAEAWRYYLDLQFNTTGPVTMESPNSMPVQIDPGYFTWGLDLLPGRSDTRYLCTMEASELGAAYAFWFECSAGPGATGTNTFRYFVPQLDTQGVPITPWDPARIVTPALTNLPTEALTDFASTTIDHTAYFFICSQSLGISMFTFSGDGFSAVESVIPSVAKATAILSIDAASVQLRTDQGMVQRLAIAAFCLDSDNNQFLACALLDPLQPTIAPQWINMPGVQNFGTHDSTIRIGWGSVPVTDGAMIKNGLVVVYNASINDAGRPNAGDTYLTVLDLDQPNYISAPWFDIKPPLSTFAEPDGFYTTENSAYIGSLTTLFPMAVKATFSEDPTASAVFGLVFAGPGLPYLPGYRDPTPTYWIFQPIPSFKLVPAATGQKTTTTPQDSMTEVDLQAAVSAWILLGVITGLPPYPADMKGPVSLQIGNLEAGSTTSQVTDSKSGTVSASVGGKMLSLGGSVTGATETTSNLVKSWTVSVDYTFSKDVGISPSEHGWLVVAQPVYQLDTYQLHTLDGQDSGLTLNVLWSIPGGASIDVIPFSLVDPNTPPNPLDAVQKLLCQFPVAAQPAKWPISTSVEEWTTEPPTNEWGLATFLDDIALQPINATTDAVFQESLVTTDIQGDATNNSLAITVVGGANLGVFKISASGTIDHTTLVASSFTASESFTIVYGSLKGTAYEAMSVAPLLYRGTRDGMPWVPTIFQGQRPWLLTWKVVYTTPNAEGASAG